MTAVAPAPEPAMIGVEGEDPFDFRIARRAPDGLREFNRAGVLTAADVHVALCLVRLAGRGGAGGATTPAAVAIPAGDSATSTGANDAGTAVLLAAALAVRAPRLGHVCTDLLTVAGTVALDAEIPLDIAALPWPEPGEWVESLATSPLVACGDEGNDDRPLRLAGTRLYLDRYWREEGLVAADLLARAEPGAPAVDPEVLSEGLDRLFPYPGYIAPGIPGAGTPDGADPAPDLQRLAARAAVVRRFSVVAGGPGTGKTTTVARILALLHEQAEAAGAPPPLVALAAPTGKAAARLEEAVHEEASRLDVSDAVRNRLLATQASTLHRLLGWRPGNRSRFRHHRGNRLPHEVVVVDETSMVSLSLMARLVEAVTPAARLVLVGDPEQLASVEAGAVLGDIVGPASGPGPAGTGAGSGAAAGLGEGIVVLRHVHRFGGGIAALAEAVRQGDADAAMALLEEGLEDLTWAPTDVAGPAAGTDLAPVRAAAVAAARAVIQAARAGQPADALVALGAFRVLCAHRHGPYGATTWMDRVERWLSVGIAGFAAEGEWYAGRPLLVTENDYGLRLFNGDTGVVVAGAAGTSRLSAVFERRGGLLEFSPTRLAAVDTVYAMTVHKSQGSQFDTVAVLLPDPGSPILTRELLYTAVTRARRRLILAGTADAVRAAVGRPIARASGLRERLWGDGGTLDAPIGLSGIGDRPRTVPE